MRVHVVAVGHKHGFESEPFADAAAFGEEANTAEVIEVVRQSH